MNALVRVVAPNFVAGFIVEDGVVVRCAPIVRAWVEGRSGDEAVFALRRRFGDDAVSVVLLSQE